MNVDGVSIITISSSRDELLKTVKSVCKSARILQINWEYVIVELKKESDNMSDLELPEFPDKIRYFPVKRGGFSYQRNIGVKNSRYDTIIFIDDGMEVVENWISAHLSHINEGADAVLGGVVPKLRKPETGSFLENILALSQGILGFPAGGLKFLSRGSHYEIGSFSTANLSIRKKLIEEVGFFDESLVFGAEDSDLSLRIKKKFPTSRFIFCADAISFAEPRKNFKDLRNWFIRRGRSFSTIVRKYYGDSWKNLLRSELIFPKLFLSSVFPLTLPLFFAVYVFRSYGLVLKVLPTVKAVYPQYVKKYIPYLPIFLPLVKFYADFYYSVGFYTQFFYNLHPLR